MKAKPIAGQLPNPHPYKAEGEVGPYKCRWCDDVRPSLPGRQLHERRQHLLTEQERAEWSNRQSEATRQSHAAARQANAVKRVTAVEAALTDPVKVDDLFDRLAASTVALFPDGIPADRVIEIADWQKQTLRLIRRT